MKLEQAHSLEHADALARVQALTQYWANRYGVQVNWTEATARIKGRVKGVKFDGDVVVGDDAVRADIEAGFLAEKLGGRSYVLRKLADYLDPQTPLDQLKTQ